MYDRNLLRARKANAAADEVRAKLGWGEREVTVELKDGIRRLDIADLRTNRAVEVKTGYQTLNKGNRLQVERDQVFVEQGWTIQWYFRGRASRGLVKPLNDAGIRITIAP